MKILTKEEKLESLKKRGELIKESFNDVFNRIKRVNDSGIRQQLNELSPEVKSRTIQAMKDKGQNQRAKKWEKYYDEEKFSSFIGKPIFGEGLIISNVEVLNNDQVIITIGTRTSKSLQNVIDYLIKRDKFTDVGLIDKASARVLAKIAMAVNPETQYRNGIGDFKVKGY